MSGVEALAAIGLASNLVAFIETALKIYKSANDNLSGLSNEFQSIVDLTDTLRNHTAAVAQGAEASVAKEDQRLVEIAKQCQSIAQDLLVVMQKYEVRDGNFRNIAVAAKAVRAAWNRSKIREMEALLDKYHTQLVSHIVFSCRSRLDGLSTDARKTALNTVDLLERSQAYHEDMNSGLGRIELGISDTTMGFRNVEAKLDGIHAILSRPLSPVPPYESTENVHRSSAYPSVLGPEGQIEAQSMPLHELALKGDTRSIHRTLQLNGVSINARDDDGQTALHLSALAGNVDFIKGLLREDNLDIDAMDNDRSTALHYAVKNKSTKIVSLLLQNGARTDIQDTDGLTAKDYAEMHTPINWMLCEGVGQDAKNEALLYFAKRGNIDAVEEMLAVGAKANAKATCGNRALMYGAMHGNVRIIKAVSEVDRSAINETNSAGKTALMLAAINGHLEAAMTLLKESPDLEIKDKGEGRTALFHALAHAHGDGNKILDSRWAIAAALVKAGAEIETEDTDAFTPLLWFCKTGKFSAVQWLVGMGANVNQQKSNGTWTPLMEAAICHDDIDGACRVINHLIDNGADTEVWNKVMGYTALWEAASLGHIHQVNTLLARGAHVNTMSKRGRLPLAIACHKGHVDVVESLLKHGSYVKTRDYMDRLPINYASQHQHLQCVRLLIQYGSPVSVQNEHLWSPLHEAAMRNQYELMVLLLEHGVVIDLKTDEGETALHMASKIDKSAAAELLIEKGASVSVAKNNGWTPLDEASSRGLHNTMKVLLAAGANPNSTSSRFGNVRRYTPLMHASRQGQLEACQILVAAGADVRLQNASGDTAYQIARSYPRVQGFLGTCQSDIKE
ncbi:Ankyrin-3 [Paramyrothecium foliicola]|nr:Ankyrin-3 [Paramyrothecium foliicola]